MSDPSARKVQGGRPRTAGLVLALVLLAGMLAATAVLAGPRDPYPRTAATNLLPPDGHREIRGTSDARVIREYAFSTGAPMMASGPAALSFATDDFEKTMKATWLRLLETTVSESGVLAHKVVALEISESGIHRRMDVEGEVISTWDPAPIVLPATIAPGSNWRTSGSVHNFTLAGDFETLGYDFAATVSVPEDEYFADQDCLVVDRTDKIGVEISQTSETWCPGAGIMAADDLLPDFVPAGTPELTSERSWNPELWQGQTVSLNAAPPMSWGTGLPVVGTSEVLVLGHEVTGDINYAPDGDVTRAWRAHPGGRLTALSQFGELIVATTTMSRAVAYDLEGAWRWQVDLPDVAVMKPALVGDAVVLVDGSGRITSVDAATGTERWSTSLSDQVVSEPAACGELTVVGTSGNELVILGADGEVVGSADTLEVTAQFACNATGEILAAVGARLERFLPDGSLLASVNMRDAIVNDVFTLDGMVITSSASALTAYDDRTLARLWRLEHQFADVEVADDTIVAIDAERIVAIDTSGREVASWPSDAYIEGMSIHLIPHGTGIGVLSPEMDYTRLA